MADDGGVLGNLPNSRPGKRSTKREAGAGRPAKTAARAAAKAESTDAPGARPPKAKPPRKRTAAVKKPASGDVPPPASEDRVAAVVRTGLGLAGTGVKVAGALTREVFKRLPRP